MPPSRIHLDCAASTPLLPAAREAMLQALEAGGNPSSAHATGRQAKDLLEGARSRAARALGCRAREIVFTANGTVASQLALLGAARARRRQGRRVVLSAVEHPAIAGAADRLATEGYEIERVPPNADGSVDPGFFLDRLEGGVAAAALMLAHHETAALLPVAAVAEGARRPGIALICDACLGPGRVPAATGDIGADLTIYSAHKINGPKGIGILHVRRGTRVEAIWRGGLQEERLHPGPENVAGAVGAALALEAALTSPPRRA
ncbi:MAG: aminotransferase class V-fold PLP-dependent enzyme, partial [Planctomycetota bacterium]